MGPNTPEQPQKKSNQEQARAAVEQILAEIRMSYQNEVARINQIQNADERIRQRALLDQRKIDEFKSKVSEQINRDTTDTGKADRPEDKQEKGKDAKHIFLEAKALGDEGVKIGDKKSQLIVDKIVENIKNGQITDQGALVLERNIGKDLIDGIVFSKKNEPLSDFENHLKISYEVDPQAVAPLLRTLGANQDVFGYEGTPQDFINKIGMSTPENGQQGALTPEQQQQLMEEMGQSRDRRFGPDGGYYETRFTDAQKDLIATFYSPEKFVDYIERLSNGDKQGGNFLTPEQVQERKQEITNNVKKYYANEKNHKDPNDLENGGLEKQVEKHWGEEVSKMMEWNISDVINQLFLELQQKSPNKFYEQIMQEDIFQGPGMIQKRIQAAINALMTEVSQIEKGDSELAKRMKKLNLYEQEADRSFIEERGKEDDLNKKIYPRIKPLTYAKNIKLTEFVRHIYKTIDHTISKAEYFHNSRAIYGQPPGKEGFYAQLGGFAEQLKGSEIDEIMLLPDGQYIMQAYQLYEKMLQEDFAQLDHRHRPDQLSTKLERVNSDIEEQVFDQLKKFYPDLTDERLRNIVNSGVGISRGIFLTESEQSAYADPIDSEGKGMLASYSTNDAASLNVFNPMHTILRWQGERNLNSLYFMPVGGQKGPWDHHKAWNNMAKYMDSLLVGHGRGVTEKGGLPEELFFDSLMDIGNVGGPGKRKGWRMKHSLEGHFIYDSDGTIDAPETFKAMEAIGYEAIYNFVQMKQAGIDIMKATEKSVNGQSDVRERKELFKYIFRRYFSKDPKNFQESEFDDYWANLKIKGEKKALDKIKKEGSLSKVEGWEVKSLEEQITLETSNLFMDNMLAHYVAVRFPTKFLRIDKNRLHPDGISHWEKIWRQFKAKGWEREHFDKVMKDMCMTEMLLRRQISERIRDNIEFDQKWKLNEIDKINDLPFRLDEDKIRELLSINKPKDKNKSGQLKTEKEINDVIELFQSLKEDFKEDDFLDEEGIKRINNYTFTFGLEDTDISLMAFRATGPRMVARAIKDVGSIETDVIPWITQMPLVLNEIAINGKHDFSPIIEYMRKAQVAIEGVNGVPATYKHMYKIAGTVINYFKKDAMAKPLFGLFKLGQKNSIAAEYAGRSTAVWEWDSRDIDRFCVALESYRLLPHNAYDLQKVEKGKFAGGQLENIWLINPITKKPFKTPFKKRHVDWEDNADKLRKDHGGDFKAIFMDYVWQFAPLAIAFLLWKYIKDAMDEASGKKKQ